MGGHLRHRLVIERGWRAADLTQWLAGSLAAVLLHAPSPGSRRRRTETSYAITSLPAAQASSPPGSAAPTRSRTACTGSATSPSARTPAPPEPDFGRRLGCGDHRCRLLQGQ
jgi:hypothetical protein